MSRPDTTSKDTVFQWRGIPQPGQLLPLGPRHMVAAVVGVITPATPIADTCGLSSADKTLIVQVSLILTALATLLQLFPILRRIGSGLPVVVGISFAYIPTLQTIGGEFGPPTVLGAEIVRSIVAIIFGVLVKWIHPLFPPLVTDTVIFIIGLSLYPTAVKYITGGAGSEWFDSAKSWAVTLITLTVVVFLNHSTKGITKLTSILIGMLAGYVIAYFLGIMDLSGMGNTAWVALPRPMPFDIQFVPTACASLDIAYVASAVQTTSNLPSTIMDGTDRMSTDKELSGGIVSQGVMSILGTLFGGLSAATYSQDVGIVAVSRVISRAVFVLAALILLVARLVPEFASLLTTIPQRAIGGATISVFATITMTGTRMITEGGFTSRRSSMVGLSVALGMGIAQMSGYLAGEGLPAWINTVFGSSSVVVATLMVILLNLILPKEPSAND